MTDAPAPGSVAAGRPIAEHKSRTRDVLGTLLKNRLSVIGLIILVLFVIAGVFGEALAPYGINEVNVPDRLMPPSTAHWFGTDELGRDVYSRVLVAARSSMVVGFVAVAISLGAGVPIGLVAGFYGKGVDAFFMRLMDILFAFPAILLAIVALAVLGPGLTSAMVAIGIVYTPIFARITRGSVLTVKEEVFVRAARSLGASDRRLLSRHVLPNILAPIIVQTSLSLAFAILSEAALSFLGLGVVPPDPSWGRMLAEARGFIVEAPWMGIFPGLAILFVVMAFNFVGDGLRDALDPRQKSLIESRGQVA